MSSGNLLKMGGRNPSRGESRIIDTNALIAERISKLAETMYRPENDGFTQGLQVQEIDVSALVSDPDENTTGDGKEELPDQEMDPEEMKEQARLILQDAKDAAGKILQDAISEAEKEGDSIRAKAREEGYQEGFHDATRKAEARLQEQLKDLEDKRLAMEQEYEKLLADLEPKFVDTLSGIYEHLFHVELGSYRDILLQLISDCLRGTEGSRSFQIHVSREDFTYVSTKKTRLLEAAGGNAQMEIVEDPSLHKNACIIKTENGIMDCGLGTQLDELTRRLKLLAYQKK